MICTAHTTRRTLALIGMGALLAFAFEAATPGADAAPFGCHNAPFVTWCDDPPVNTRGDHLHGVCHPAGCDYYWLTGDGRMIDYPGQP